MQRLSAANGTAFRHPYASSSENSGTGLRPDAPGPTSFETEYAQPIDVAITRHPFDVRRSTFATFKRQEVALCFFDGALARISKLPANVDFIGPDALHRCSRPMRFLKSSSSATSTQDVTRQERTGQPWGDVPARGLATHRGATRATCCSASKTPDQHPIQRTSSGHIKREPDFVSRSAQGIRFLSVPEINDRSTRIRVCWDLE